MKNLAFILFIYLAVGCNEGLLPDDIMNDNFGKEVAINESEPYRITINLSRSLPGFFLLVDIQDGETGMWSYKEYEIPTDGWGTDIRCKRNDFLYVGLTPIEGYWWSGGYGYGEHCCVMNDTYGSPYFTICADGDPNHRVFLDFTEGELGEVKLSYSSTTKNYIGCTYYFETSYNLPKNVSPKIAYSSRLGSGTVPLTYVEDGLYRFDFIPSNNYYTSTMDIQVLPELHNPENLNLGGLFMHGESFSVSIPY